MPFEASELEIAVNYYVHIIERGMPVSCEISWAGRRLLACPPDWTWGPPPSQCCHR